MRFIKDLSQETKKLLRRISRQSRYYRVRQRALSLILSAEGYTTTELMKIFSVDRDTIYNWFNAWEALRLAGLYDRKGKGRKSSLTPKQSLQVKQWAKEFPKNLKKIGAMIQEECGISVSEKTIKRMLKRLGLTWRRIRQKVNGEPDPVEYQEKKEVLEALKRQSEQGEIDLRYFDESGFCLTPYVPYAWQEKNNTIQVETTPSKRLNVLGFLNTSNELRAYTIEGTINSEVVIACMDDFCKDLTKKTVVVIDNASFHQSKGIQAKIPKWEAKDLKLFYLPSYSPQLNLIENLWRKIKYEWIELSAYLSFDHLVDYVERILRNFGDKYRINFV
jgi:transposase